MKAQDKIEQLNARFNQLIQSKPEWEEDLEVALSGREFSDKQISALHEAATDSVFTNLPDGEGGHIKLELSQTLAHAFHDPVSNGAMALRFTSNDANLCLETLVNVRRALEDITHNGPLLLGDEMPGNFETVIEQFKTDFLPRIDDALSALSQETGRSPDDVEKNDQWQHIGPLPDDFDTLA